MLKIEQYLKNLETDCVVVSFDFARWKYTQLNKLLTTIKERGEDNLPAYHLNRGKMLVWKSIMEASCEHQRPTALVGEVPIVESECTVCGYRFDSYDSEDYKSCYNCQFDSERLKCGKDFLRGSYDTCGSWKGIELYGKGKDSI